MRVFLYKAIIELKYGCEICAFIPLIMRNFPFLCAICVLRGPNIITGKVGKELVRIPFRINM